MGAGCFYVVGVAGFEPTTSSSRTKHATKLRHTPREATTAYRTGGVRSQTLEPELTRGQRLSPGIPQYRQTLAVLRLVHLALGVGVAQRALPTAAPEAACDQDDADDYQRPERQQDHGFQSWSTSRPPCSAGKWLQLD